jgi:dipeptidyl aminopeptidase/acylaminoacyl peptidase
VFRAAASWYGIGDLEALAHDTHKFEARYEERLVGPYPAMAERYRARSPLHAADRIGCPVIFFQGLDDPVVPPSQSEAMVTALRARDRPVAYVAFPGESHGFRRADTIRRALESELSFYGQVLGFQPADPIPPVAIQGRLDR